MQQVRRSRRSRRPRRRPTSGDWLLLAVEVEVEKDRKLRSDLFAMLVVVVVPSSC